jgi:hypothetical protein
MREAEFLEKEGVQALIRLTNEQFAFWGKTLTQAASGSKMTAGDFMDFWFVLSTLALKPGFSMPKKDSYNAIKISTLEPDTVRKYVAKAQKLGFVQTVATRGARDLHLTQAGATALAMTMERWINEFSNIQRRYFEGDDAQKS